MAFITLQKRSMYGLDLGPVTVAADQISRMQRSDEYPLTDVYLKDGASFSVSESVDDILGIIKGAQRYG